MLSKINKMPIAEQNAIASLLAEELAWKKSFDDSQDELQLLAAQAVNEVNNANTEPAF